VEGRVREGRIKKFHYFVAWEIYPLNASSPQPSPPQKAWRRGGNLIYATTPNTSNVD